MSMAVSLEARVPLLDHKLVEFAASLPQNLKLRKFTRKYLLKKVGKAWLPPEVLSRKKQGFPMPTSLWLRKEARPFMRDVLSRSALKRRGLFHPPFVEKLMNEHERGFANHGWLLWGLMNVELWQRIFMDSHVRPKHAAPSLAPQLA
jgi:asparagine synthase (glutamine-hydrolysing)